MNYWKFVCKNDTEAECFQRGLFGQVETYLDQVRRVRRGDMLILYNIESDILFAPFTAESDGARDLEPDAWGGRFPAQVRVSWKWIKVVRNASHRYPFVKQRRIELRPSEFSSIIEGAYQQTVPEKILNELRKLDAEIHALAHRIEEDLMIKKGHPADRIVTLELHRAEFLSKMRDFVWTVRKLDMATNLFKLPSSNPKLFK